MSLSTSRAPGLLRAGAPRSTFHATSYANEKSIELNVEIPTQDLSFIRDVLPFQFWLNNLYTHLP